MKIIFAGTPEFAAVALDRLRKSEHDIIAVYTQPDRPAGRGRKMTASAVKKLAIDANIPVYQPASLKTPEEQHQLMEFDADLMIVAAYGLLLPKTVLQIPRLGCINIHASLLPRWRGAAPIQRAILAGDSETGITIMQMDEGLDTGGMLLKESCEILPSDNAQSLHDKLAIIGGNAIIKAVADLENGQFTAEKQNDSLACYAKKLQKTEAPIDWNKPAIELQRQIQAYNPWPVAQCLYEDKVLRVWQATSTGEKHYSSPGEIVAVDKKTIDVATSCGCLKIEKVQLPGGKPMDASSFANGRELLGYILK